MIKELSYYGYKEKSFEVSDEFPYKIGDRIRVTATIVSTNSACSWVGVTFGPLGSHAVVYTNVDDIGLENLGPADPENWPPQVGDIWEAEGQEFIIKISRNYKGKQVAKSIDGGRIFMPFEFDGLKELNPRLVRRREV